MKKKWFIRILILLLIFVLIGVIAVGALFYKFKADYFAGKAFSKYNLPYSVIFTDRNGQEFYRSFDNQNREWVNLSEVADSLKEITVLTEDRRFFHHFGVDFRGILRAAIANFQAGHIVQGGSTLTQQIAKKAFLTDEKTILRKVREAFIALGIESEMSKNEILEMYINMAPYGATLSGVKSSAKFYFDKIPRNLTIAESLVLAMLPQNPVILSRKLKVKDWLGTCSDEKIKNCSPFNDPHYQRSRIEEILFLYAQKHNLPPEKVAEIWHDLQKIKLPKRKNFIYSDFQHFRFFVEKFLARKGINLLDYPGGLIVKTSIDKDLQTAVSKFLREEAAPTLEKEFSAKNAAFLILEHNNRAPLVWVGSVDYWNNKINGQVDMLQSRRQTGSTIKPFIYAKMFEMGFTPQTIMWDTRVRFSGERKILQNSDGHYLGAIPAKTALATSRNVPAAQALYISGGEKSMRKFLDRTFGFNINRNYKNNPFGWTLSLGTAPIKLMDLANGYATLATGKLQKICPILEIKTTTDQKIRGICDKSSKKFLKADARFFVNNTISNRFLRPAGTWRNNLTLKNANIAAKTGTSSTKVRGIEYPIDNYVIGYTPEVTILSWTGNANGGHLKQGSFGTLSIAPYWKQIAEGLFEKYPEFSRDFTPPPNVIKKDGGWTRADNSKNRYKIPAMIFVSKEENRRKALLQKQKSRLESREK